MAIAMMAGSLFLCGGKRKSCRGHCRLCKPLPPFGQKGLCCCESMPRPPPLTCRPDCQSSIANYQVDLQWHAHWTSSDRSTTVRPVAFPGRGPAWSKAPPSDCPAASTRPARSDQPGQTDSSLLFHVLATGQGLTAKEVDAGRCVRTYMRVLFVIQTNAVTALHASGRMGWPESSRFKHCIYSLIERQPADERSSSE